MDVKTYVLTVSGDVCLPKLGSFAHVRVFTPNPLILVVSRLNESPISRKSAESLGVATNEMIQLEDANCTLWQFNITMENPHL